MAAFYTLARIGGPVGQGVMEAYNAQLNAVIKNSEALKYCIPNEFICAELGRAIGIPIPPCGIVYAPGHPVKYWFASLNFNLTSNPPPPVDGQACVNALPRLCAGIVLFDILTANPDRHRGNLYFDPSSKPPKMSVFDHSHALFGHVDGKGGERLRELKNRLGISGGTVTGQNRHCLLDKLNDDRDFGFWYKRIRAIPDHLIQDACRNTVEMKWITAHEANEAEKFLIYRRNNISGLVKLNKNEFTSIRTWSLIYYS